MQYYVSCGPQSHQWSSFASSGLQHKTERSSIFKPSRLAYSSDKHGESSHEPNPDVPSLGHSSSPSLEDETSPKTPILTNESDKACDQRYCTPVQEKEAPARTIDNVATPFATGPPRTSNTKSVQSLPCRSKSKGEATYGPELSHEAPRPWKQSSQIPAVFEETAVRSRLARRPGPQGADLLENIGINGSQPSAVVTFNSRCHARRRACAASVGHPPKLRRDTDCTDAIVRLLVCFSTRLVNSIWTQSATPSKASQSAGSAGVLPLQVFIQETLRRSKTSYSTLQVALLYLILLKPHVRSRQRSTDQPGGCRALQCGRRMFLTALILASKYLQDRNYSSRAWSKISGLPIAEINENERHYLALIHFNLHIKKDVFENWSRIVLTLCRVGDANGFRKGAMYGPTPSTEASAAVVEPGSDSWWLAQVQKLNPELVNDSDLTDEYLSSLATAKVSGDFSPEQLATLMDTPPSSPEALQGETATENKLIKLGPDSVIGQSSVSSLPEVTRSPASVGPLPSRPYPANLPTPQSTPASAWALARCRPGPRCKASSQALLNLDKQSLNSASLETCPPPKPRPCDVRARLGNTAFYRDQSALSYSLTAPSTSSQASSPDSITSDVSVCTTRSRSSSISSTSSVWWPSAAHHHQQQSEKTRLPPMKEEAGFPGALLDAPRAEVPASYRFYHSTAAATKPRFEDEGYGFSEYSQSSQPSSQSASKSLDEGYISDVLEQDKVAQKLDMALMLTDLNQPPLSSSRVMSMSSSPAAASDIDDANATPVAVTQSLPTLLQASRPPKRERSMTSDSAVHENTRALLLSASSEQRPIEVLDNYSGFSVVVDNDDDTAEKQLQFPERAWASPKKPIPNGQLTKRIAVQQTTRAAPMLAAGYLWNEMSAR